MFPLRAGAEQEKDDPAGGVQGTCGTCRTRGWFSPRSNNEQNSIPVILQVKAYSPVKGRANVIMFVGLQVSL